MWGNTQLAKAQLILAAAAIVAGCGSDSITEPGSDNLRLEAISATQLQGTVGEAVGPVPRVIVRNLLGAPVAGVTVSFSVLGGTFWTTPDSYINFGLSGSVTQTTTVTDAQGIASPGEWTLGTNAGLQGLHADFVGSAGGRQPFVLFYAEAAPAAPARLWLVGGDQQAGLPGWGLWGPTVRVEDRFGNGVRALVSFTVTGGGGALAPGEIQSDEYGYASATWTLGPTPGLNSGVASALDLHPVTFTAEAVDTGALTWYDVEAMDGRTPFARSSIGLGENGYFALLTDGGVGFPEDLTERSVGTYAISDGGIVLAHHGGALEEGTLGDDQLSLRRGDYLKLYLGLSGSDLWTYRKRSEK